MKYYRTFYLLVLAALMASADWTMAAAPLSGAKNRAALYQAEARIVLTSYHWSVAVDKSGILVATHLLGPQGASFAGSSPGTGPMYAHLTVKFQADSVRHTGCTANIVAYLYGTKNPAQVQKSWIGPIPFNNADSTKDVQDMMAEAEKQMTTKHPEYAAK